MESCHLPLEICHLVIDMVYISHPLIIAFDDTDDILIVQRTIYACALTCRAWRARAQRRLWANAHLPTAHSVRSFAASLCSTPDLGTSTEALCLSGHDRWPKKLGLVKTSGLFMQTLPVLETLRCYAIVFDLGPRTLRLRFPFLGSLKVLSLWGCVFESVRTLLDVIWGCPNVASVILGRCSIRRMKDVPANTHLAAICTHLGACRKLTSLTLYSTILLLNPPFPGSVFGSAVTRLEVELLDTTEAQRLTGFLRGSFPALTSIHVRLCSGEDTHQPSLLSTLIEGVAHPERLRTIVLGERNSCLMGAKCAAHLVRNGDERTASGEPLRNSFSALENLTVGLHAACVDNAAASVNAALPSLGGILHCGYGGPRSNLVR